MMDQDEVYWKVIPVTTIGIMILTTFCGKPRLESLASLGRARYFTTMSRVGTLVFLRRLAFLTMCYGQLHTCYDAIRDGRILYLVICLLCNI